MTKLKIIVSPFYSEESFEDKTTGFVFHKTDSPYVISLDDARLGGIKEGLRKNFLIPYDKPTLEFITKNDLPLTPSEPSKPVASKPEPEIEQESSTEVQEESEVSPVVEEEKTKKNRARKKKEVAEETAE